MPAFGELPDEQSSMDVINKIHRGLLSEESWLAALQAMARFVGADSAHCMERNREADSVTVLESVGMTPEANRAYTERFYYLDPGRRAMQDAPIGKIYVDRMHAESDAKSAEFYEEYMRPHDMSSYMSMMVDRYEPCELLITFDRRWGRPFFERHNEQALYSLLEPLRVAVQVRMKMQALQCAQHWTRGALDHVSLPMLVVDGEGVVRLANASGSRWMRRSDFPLTSASCKEVLAIIRDACGQGGATPRTVSISVQAGLERPSIVMAVPIPGNPLVGGRASPRVALLLELATPIQTLPRQLLRQIFRLTPSEVTLTSHLACGLSLAEAAERSQISRETARSHLKAVLRKTGTHRQSELMALLTGMSVVHH